MRKFRLPAILLALVFALGACTTKVLPGKKGLPALKVSENHRYLVDEKGNPFFWLGDTGWLLFTKLNREDAEKYLTDRADKGFNVIQIMMLHSLGAKNFYGDSALINQNVADPLVTAGNSFKDTTQYDYWDHMDFVIDKAAEKGLYVGLVPIWGGNVKSSHVKKTDAAVYAAWIANRYKDRSNIIWLNGGDVMGSDSIQIWKTIGSTIKATDTNHLITFHPFGRKASSIWFHNEDWLDFNMFQSGHRRYDQDDSQWAFGEDNWKYVELDYAKTPAKPTIDGEPSYEGIPQGLHDTLQPFWKAEDVRRYAYWSVFAGAFGFTYGNSAVMQFHMPTDKGSAYGAKEYWYKAINNPGACQMQYLKKLMLSHPFLERVPDQSLIAGENGQKYEHLAATRGNDYAMVYTYTGKIIPIQMGKIKGKKVKASWFKPANGEITKIGEFTNTGTHEFDPPGEPDNGNDWVLVLDSVK
ncbi:MAG: glycoside hydrolase family 140 protein [Bacteroidia bacterium]|nr:glycoside hydrolase family 140 protein [Bacteroidia bacterium]